MINNCMYDGIYLTELDINAASGAGAVFIPDFFMNPDGEAWFQRVLYENRFKKKFQNLKTLNEHTFVVLDTETIGLGADDEVIELGIINKKGEILYNSLFKNTKPVYWAAAKVNRIKKSDLESAPLFKDEWPKIRKILKNKTIIVFNKGFDCKLIEQTLQRYGLDKSEVAILFSNQIDAMEIFISYFPQKKNKISLEKCCQNLSIFKKEEHRAVADSKLTLLMLHELDKQIEETHIDFSNDKTQTQSIQSSPVQKDSKTSSELKSKLKVLYDKGIHDIKVLANQLNVSVYTVEKILFNSFTSQEIDFSCFIQPEYSAIIKSVIEGMPCWNGRLKPIKERLPDEVSYVSIRAVIRYYNLTPAM